MMHKPILVRIRERDYEFLDQQLRALAPHRRLGFPKTTILAGFCGAIVVALRRPNHYSIGEMIQKMCLAAVPEEDQEGRKQIEQLFL